MQRMGLIVDRLFSSLAGERCNGHSVDVTRDSHSATIRSAGVA
jgi:hypothetical protein